MAEKIAEITASRGGAPRKYPWDEWADGSAWRITKGEDYDIPSSSIAAMIRQRAAQIGARASAVVVDAGGAVEFQFVLPAPEAAAEEVAA